MLNNKITLFYKHVQWHKVQNLVNKKLLYKATTSFEVNISTIPNSCNVSVAEIVCNITGRNIIDFIDKEKTWSDNEQKKKL